MEWISVKDKLPSPQEMVVFFYDDQFHIGYFISKSQYHEEYLWQSHIDGYNCVHDITHWMPLPKSPQDGNKWK